MKHLTLIFFFMTFCHTVSADIAGGNECKSALQGFDASHNKLTKLASDISKSEKLKKSKVRHFINELEKAIELGNNASQLCTITGKDKEQFDGYHNLAKSTLAFYKSQGLDKL